MFGKLIKLMRTIEGLSISEVSNKTGVSITYISDMEKGRKNKPSLAILKQFANGYGISLVDFMELIEYQEEKNTTDKLLMLEIIKKFAERDLKSSKEVEQNTLIIKILRR